MSKIALITGQDGAYLVEFLLQKGYVVHGLKRRSSLFNTDRIIQKVQPDEIYNLAAMSHVAVDFNSLEYTANADGLGSLLRLRLSRINHRP